MNRSSTTLVRILVAATASLSTVGVAAPAATAMREPVLPDPTLAALSGAAASHLADLAQLPPAQADHAALAAVRPDRRMPRVLHEALLHGWLDPRTPTPTSPCWHGTPASPVVTRRPSSTRCRRPSPLAR
jgi:hypothetical protein